MTLNARGGIAHFHRAIIIDRGAFDHSVDVIPVLDGSTQQFEHHNARPAAKDGSLRLCIKGAAMSIGRENHILLIKIALVLRHLDRHATRQRHVALTSQEALTSQMHRHQRRRASGLHIDTWSPQIQFVRDACRHKTRSVVKPDLEIAA